MTRDMARIRRLRQGLQEESLDALICTLPHNVLLLCGCGKKVRVFVEQAGKRVFDRTVAPGTTVEIMLP